MKRRTISLAMLAWLAGIEFEAFPQQTQPAEPVAGVIKMTAKKYEFDPSVIRIKKGDHVRLLVTALDRDHGFKLEAFRIDEKLEKGKAVEVEFTADQAGTFPFQCSRFCGIGIAR